MKQALKFGGSILIFIGFLCLIITEFAVDAGDVVSPDCTIIFGAIGAVGLAMLAFAHYAMKTKT